MSAISKVGIANRALQLLGAGRIEALDQDSPNAREMNLAYDPVRRALLREYNWNFAIKRASIPATSGQTEFEGLNRFEKPNDYIKMLRQTNSIQGDSYRPDWQIEGQYIVTSEDSPLEIRYIADIENPALFDHAFAELLSVRLAQNCVEAITGSSEIDNRVARAEITALTMAKQSNSLENDADVPLEDDWLLERL